MHRHVPTPTATIIFALYFAFELLCFKYGFRGSFLYSSAEQGRTLAIFIQAQQNDAERTMSIKHWTLLTMHHSIRASIDGVEDDGTCSHEGEHRLSCGLGVSQLSWVHNG